MVISESKLKTWSHLGAVSTAKATHESIQNALDSCEWPSTPKVYLQGSYRNNTNIRGDSDVDIIVQLNSAFRRDLSALSEPEKKLYRYYHDSATYSLKEFRVDILNALCDYYGASAVSEGNKAVKVAGGSNRLPADVVICIQYRRYQHFRDMDDQEYIEGIAIHTLRENREVINFPKLHYSNGTNKNAQHKTDGWYKPTVRVFKNARSHLIDRGIITETLAPSYFLECLLYNVPDEYFGGDYQRTVVSVSEWLIDSFSNGSYQNLSCQNKQLPLFGDTPEQWSVGKAVELFRSLIKLWRD